MSRSFQRWIRVVAVSAGIAFGGAGDAWAADVPADGMTPLRSRRTAPPRDSRPVAAELAPRGDAAPCTHAQADVDAFRCADAYLRWVDALPRWRCLGETGDGAATAVVDPATCAAPEPGYRFGWQLHESVAERVRATPGRVTPFLVGSTVRGRPLWGFRVREPGRAVTARVLVVANMHAMEWVPSEVAVEVLREAALHPAPGVELTVVPTLNPDGRARVEHDLRAGDNVFRRGNANNVDLNRDFAENRDSPTPFRWTMPWRYGSSPGPLSQPESRALDVLADTVRFDAAVSLHAFGGYIFYPWAGLWERPAEWGRLHALARTMQAGMGGNAYRPRQLSRYLFTFVGQGMEIDHLHRRYGTAAILVETTRSGLSPWRPREWGTHFRLYNPRDPAPHVREGARAVHALVWALRDDTR